MRILNEGTPCFFPPFLKRDGHQINSHELASGCFQDLLFKNSLIIPPSPGELYWNLSNYKVVNLNDDTLLAMPFKKSIKSCEIVFLCISEYREIYGFNKNAQCFVVSFKAPVTTF